MIPGIHVPPTEDQRQEKWTDRGGLPASCLPPSAEVNMSTLLAEIFDDLEVPADFWARLVGASGRQMTEWMAGQRELPFSVAETLSKAIGVPAEILAAREKRARNAQALLPPLWLKARQSGLGETEHRAIALARVLAASHDEVLSVLDSPSVTYRLMFNEIRANVDPQQPARIQGALGGQAFLEFSTLGGGALGIGEVLRGFLRARGVLIIETPINNRKLEGFCVPVGRESRVRPCVVANSYRTTWFRRNYVILHELCHAIFDLEAANAVFDVAGADAVDTDVAEQRADSFAMHALVPKRLLVAMQNRGVRLDALSNDGLAQLVADTHAEHPLIARAALEYELISEADAQRLARLDIARELREKSYHARGLAEVPPGKLPHPEVAQWGNRLTTFPVAGVRLPIPFVRLVLRALEEGKISPGRAAELLMVTEDQLESRFGVPARPDKMWAEPV